MTSKALKAPAVAIKGELLINKGWIADPRTAGNGCYVRAGEQGRVVCYVEPVTNGKKRDLKPRQKARAVEIATWICEAAARKAAMAK